MEDTTVTGVIDELKMSQRDQAIQSILAGRGVTDPDEPIEDDPVDPPAPEPELVTIKVDGQETQVPVDQVREAGIKALQKESAADKRLFEAAAREKALKQREEELARMEADLLKKRDAVPDETGKEFVDAVFSDPERAAATISTIARQVQNVTQKIEQKEKVEVETKQKTLDEVGQYFISKYSAAAKDDDMYLVMNRRFQKIAAERMPTFQDIDTIATEVYARFNVPLPGSEPPPPDPAEERRKAKENMPRQARRASARVEQPPAEKPKTLSEKIDAMRAGRGPRAY